MNKKHLINLLIILAIGLIAYANSFSCDFVWDAVNVIKNNAYVHGFSAVNFRHAFSGVFFDSVRDFNFYRPLTMLSFMLDYSVWKLNPAGYHLTNFILHYINACLIYMILFYCSRRYLLSLFLCLFFIAHPSATEAITYIASRSDPLMLILLIISILFFRLWLIRPPKRSYYAFSVLSFTLACLTKEVAVIFPVFLSFYAALTTGETPVKNKKKVTKPRKKIPAVIPYFIIAAAYLLLRHFVIKSSGSTFFVRSSIGLLPRLIMAPAIILKYIATFLLPRTFIMEEPIPVYDTIFSPGALFGAIVLIAGLWLIIRSYRSKSAMGAAWFLAFIFPVSGIVSINSFFYNHWLYIPSLGLLVIVSDLLIKADGALKKMFPRLNFKYAAYTIAVVLVALSCGLTIKQNRHFKDNLTLYGEIIKKYPNEAKVHYNLGNTYKALGRIDDAVGSYNEAIRLKANYSDAYYNLANIYRDKGEYREAIDIYRKALAKDPDSFDVHNNLALTYINTGQKDKAIAEFQEVIRVNPRYAEGYSNLGVIYMEKGLYDEAIKMFKKATGINPGLVNAHDSLGIIYCQTERYDEAINEFEVVLRLDPGRAATHNDLAALYAMKGAALKKLDEN